MFGLSLSLSFFNEDVSPYELAATEDDFPNVWAGQTTLKSEINRIVTDQSPALSKHIITIWGQFGSGKTHKLLWLKNKIEKEKLGYCIISRIPQGVKNFAGIYKDLFFDNIWDDAVHKLKRIAIETMDHDIRDLRNFVGKTFTNKNPALTQGITKLLQLLRDWDIDHEEVVKIQNWLRGETPARSLKQLGWRKLGLGGDPTDFINCTITILKILMRKQANGKSSAVFWFVDDCHILSAERKFGKDGIARKSPAFDNVQKGFLDVYNNSSKGLTLVFAYAGDTQHSVDLSPDIVSRLHQRIIISDLTEKQSKNYIKELHSNPKYSTKPDRKNQFYPLNEESVECLLELFRDNALQNTPRRINHYLDVILRDGQKQKPPLDVEFIKSRFKVRSKQIEQGEQAEEFSDLEEVP